MQLFKFIILKFNREKYEICLYHKKLIFLFFCRIFSTVSLHSDSTAALTFSVVFLVMFSANKKVKVWYWRFAAQQQLNVSWLSVCRLCWGLIPDGRMWALETDATDDPDPPEHLEMWRKSLWGGLTSHQAVIWVLFLLCYFYFIFFKHLCSQQGLLWNKIMFLNLNVDPGPCGSSKCSCRSSPQCDTVTSQCFFRGVVLLSCCIWSSLILWKQFIDQGCKPKSNSAEISVCSCCNRSGISQQTLQLCVSVYVRVSLMLFVRADVRHEVVCKEQLICRGFQRNMQQRHKFKWIQEAMAWKENNKLLSVLKLEWTITWCWLRAFNVGKQDMKGSNKESHE